MNYTKEQTLEIFLSLINNDSEQMYYVKNLVEAYPNIIEKIINNEYVDLTKVKYVKYKRFEYLKNKILDNVNLLNLSNNLENVFNLQLLKKIKKVYEETYNKYNDELIIKEIKNSPYEFLCKINGIGFIKADQILITAYNKSKNIWHYDLKSSKIRCLYFLLWYLSNCLNGSTFAYLNVIINKMKYEYNLSECLNTINEALLDNRIFKIDDNRIMLTYVYLQEKNIANKLKQGLINNNSWNINIKNFINLDNFILTEQQQNVLNSINNNQITLLNGYAGTGKSSCIKALINMLDKHNKSYLLLAPTAKAAKMLTYYTNKNASTIHMSLYKHFIDVNTDEIDFYSTLLNINNNINNEKYNYDIIIIDECSMLSIGLFNLLLNYIDLKRTKLLLIGDSYQLPSIQNGNLYQDLLNIYNFPKITLDKIFRYTEDGLINVATNIRYGKKYLSDESIQHFGSSYSFFKCHDFKEMINSSLNKYIDLLNDGNNIQDIAILTAKNIGNSGTNVLNSCVQKIVNTITENDSTISINIDNNIIHFKENDIVMNIKNNYKLKPIGDESDKKYLISNGHIGKIKSINPFSYTMIVTFDEYDYLLEYEDICNLRLGYCFTVHKAQGSQFKHVIFLTSNEDYYMTTSNLLYVGITRAQESCFHFGSNSVVNNKVSEQENLKRNTMLCEIYNSLNEDD